MITFKMDIDSIEGDLEPYFVEYNMLRRIAYNILADHNGDILPKEVYWKLKERSRTLDSVFIGWAINDAQRLFKSQKASGTYKIIFGGKNRFMKRLKGEISNKEWKNIRNSYIYCLGYKLVKFGNKKVKIDIKNKIIIFCPRRGERILIKLKCGQKQIDKILKFEELAKNKCLKIAYQISRKFVNIIIDENLISKKSYSPIINRTMGIDLNPNYIAISVSDFNNGNPRAIIRKIFDLRTLNKEHTTKVHHELHQISHQIFSLCCHYKVNIVSMERLDMPRKDYKKGAIYNRLINNWNRNKITNNLKKLCNENQIPFLLISPVFSSFIGCLAHPEDIDSVAASIEIARWGNLYYNTFINKTLPRNTQIIFPKWDSRLMNRWKEELGLRTITGWKDAHNWFKSEKPKIMYRFLIGDYVEKHSPVFFRLKSRKSRVFVLDIPDKSKILLT